MDFHSSAASKKRAAYDKLKKISSGGKSGTNNKSVEVNTNTLIEKYSKKNP
ncbi:hypothetical protein [Serratia quinivorans]|uniref:hypothetical protein n=1 Tax=Serratia quinivorans TaxID=137545 RepID=UPI00398209BE